MSKTQYDADVLIVGGGPSGSICAYYLAKAGKKVILIDAEVFPRDKICGDFVSPVGLNELMAIGIGELDDFEKTNIITAATVYLDGVPLITKTLPQIKGLPNYGRVIPRIILDNWILEAARAQGAQVITPCRLINYSVKEDCVHIDCNHGGIERKIIAKMIIGADGSNSKVARIMHGKKTAPENKIVAVRAYFENINCVPQQAELFFSSKSFPGYYWFFPTSATTANVGIGMMLENFPKEDINLNKMLGDMIKNDPSFKAIVGNGKAIDKIVGFPLSIYNPKAPLIADRILLTGDAAGLVNSINGEGMQYAMQSGRWAAESVIECLSANDLSSKSLRIFETKIRSKIGYDMSISNIVMQFIRNRNLNPLWLKLLSIMIAQARKDEKYANIAGGILAGMIPTNTAIKIYFIRKSLFRGLIFPFTEASGFLSFMRNAISFGGNAFFKVFEQKRAYWNWIKNILSSVRSTIGLYSGQKSDIENINNRYVHSISETGIPANDTLQVEIPNNLNTQKIS
ncbi:MAG: putative electron transfer oxidoreductase [Segetibacter sp.]|nr:putative electron transfer oxidoreductase [Segetibacter sp.]